MSLQRNKDVKAWIQIPNTNVNYPVLQGETNDTYIHSDIDHNELSAGSILSQVKMKIHLMILIRLFMVII